MKGCKARFISLQAQENNTTMLIIVRKKKCTKQNKAENNQNQTKKPWFSYQLWVKIKPCSNMFRHLDMGLPGGLVVKNLPAMQKIWVQSLEEGMAEESAKEQVSI